MRFEIKSFPHECLFLLNKTVHLKDKRIFYFEFVEVDREKITSLLDGFLFRPQPLESI
jgi:hypothetical protein